jgi:hypothetical protein
MAAQEGNKRCGGGSSNEHTMPSGIAIIPKLWKGNATRTRDPINMDLYLRKENVPYPTNEYGPPVTIT